MSVGVGGQGGLTSADHLILISRVLSRVASREPAVGGGGGGQEAVKTSSVTPPPPSPPPRLVAYAPD